MLAGSPTRTPRAPVTKSDDFCLRSGRHLGNDMEIVDNHHVCWRCIFLAKLGNNSQIRQAALVRLMEAILGAASQENVAQIRGKHKNRESGEETSHA